MKKEHAITVLEVALGLLPASVVLLPLLIGGAMGAAVAVGAMLADGSKSIPMGLSTALLPAGIVLWVLSAALGLAALWVSVLARARLVQRPRGRVVLAAGLLCGTVAAALWLFVMGTSREAHGPSTWAFWIGVLAGPLIVGIRHLVLLARNDQANA